MKLLYSMSKYCNKVSALNYKQLGNIYEKRIFFLTSGTVSSNRILPTLHDNINCKFYSTGLATSNSKQHTVKHSDKDDTFTNSDRTASEQNNNDANKNDPFQKPSIEQLIKVKERITQHVINLLSK